MQSFVDPSLNCVHCAFDEVTSTNDEAFRLGQERAEDLLFVTAKKQTQGRGRRGRAWSSDEGNLFMSAYLQNPAPKEACAQLSFVAALALQESICALTDKGHKACRVKWPNDLLWQGAKIAGILLEARTFANRMNMVVGIGVNCKNHPSDTPYPATNLEKVGIPFSADVVFQSFKNAFVQRLEQWERGANFDFIRNKWIAVSKGVGEEIVVRLEREEVRGVFRDIDALGQLILRLEDGSDRIIAAGDVFFPDQ